MPRPGYKQGIVEGRAADIVYSNLFTGVHGNYLRSSIVAAGLDPDNLPESDLSDDELRFGRHSKVKAWKRHLGLGPGDRRGPGGRRRSPSSSSGSKAEYRAARARIARLARRGLERLT